MVISLALAGIATGCGSKTPEGSSGNPCNEDGDCAEGTCIDNICVESTGASCTEKTDCAANEDCVDGQCTIVDPSSGTKLVNGSVQSATGASTSTNFELRGRLSPVNGTMKSSSFTLHPPIE